MAALGLVLIPGTASAANEVTPVVECVGQNRDGSYRVLLGYTNSSSSAVPIAHGSENTVTPARYQGTQPATFQPGTHRGVLTVTLTAAEYSNGQYWSLHSNVAKFGFAWRKSTPACPPTTELPADGNGTGTAAAVGVAGLVGAAVLIRLRRTTTRLTDGPATPRA